MTESTNTRSRVSVLFYYDGDDDYARPVRLMWHGREHELAPVKFWHITHRGGDKLVHHYTVDTADNAYTFQLALETENLTWTMERWSDNTDPGQEQPAVRSLIGALA